MKCSNTSVDVVNGPKNTAGPQILAVELHHAPQKCEVLVDPPVLTSEKHQNVALQAQQHLILMIMGAVV